MTDGLIGKYRVIRKLGAGGMATVYLACHCDIPNLRTVLKELSDPLLADRFRSEADKLALLGGHGGICQINHFFDFDDKFYIVMEYIDGFTLDELVRSGEPPDQERSVEIVRSVLDTLAFAHQQGIVHRDIKPTNIMVDRLGQVKIIDFGIAKGTTDPDLTQAGAPLGSPRYMPPEQFTAGDAIDWVRCDIYTVGVTLYYLLTHDFPFKGISEFEICQVKHEGNFELPSRLNPAISPALEGIVLKAMARDPLDRFSSADEMKSALLALAPVTGPHAGAGLEDTIIPGPGGPGGPGGPDVRATPTPMPTPTPHAVAPRDETVPPVPDTPDPTPRPEIAPPRSNRLLIAVFAAIAAAALCIWGLQQLGSDDPARPPVPQAPAMNAVLEHPDVEFRWTDTQGTAGPYELELVDPGTPNIRTFAKHTGSILRMDEPLPDGSYQWRVRATPRDRPPGPWSDYASFTIARPSPEEPIDQQSDTPADVVPEPEPERTRQPAPTSEDRIEVRVAAKIDVDSIRGASVRIDGILQEEKTPEAIYMRPGKRVVVVTYEIKGVVWRGEETLDVKEGMKHIQSIQLHRR